MELEWQSSDRGLPGHISGTGPIPSHDPSFPKPLEALGEKVMGSTNHSYGRQPALCCPPASYLHHGQQCLCCMAGGLVFRITWQVQALLCGSHDHRHWATGQRLTPCRRAEKWTGCRSRGLCTTRRELPILEPAESGRYFFFIPEDLRTNPIFSLNR